MKNILIVHGWMHSAERYSRLSCDIERAFDCKVYLYEFPGFGETESTHYFGLLEGYANAVAKLIYDNQFDYVIGHSMGGNVLLRALEIADVKSKLILLSPEYRGISYLKPLIIFYPIMPLILYIIQNIHCKMTTFLIKIVALLTVNRWKQIDDRIVEDSRKANPFVAVVSMFELTWDFWKVTRHLWEKKEVYLILGQKDRIILRKKIQQLQRDLPYCNTYQIPNIGHTAVVEAYGELLKIIIQIICKGANDND